MKSPYGVVTSKQQTGLTMIGSGSNGHRFLDIAEVKKRTGLSRATIYNYVGAGIFPRQRKLGPRRVAWLESDVDAWIAERKGAS